MPRGGSDAMSAAMKREIGPVVGRGVLAGERHQRRIPLDAKPLHARHARGQAKQCGAGAAAALQHAIAWPRRYGGGQQHRLDAAAEAASGLGIPDPAVEEMAVGDVTLIHRACRVFSHAHLQICILVGTWTCIAATPPPSYASHDCHRILCSE